MYEMHVLDDAAVFVTVPGFNTGRFNEHLAHGRYFEAAEMSLTMTDATQSLDLVNLAVDRAIAAESARELALITGDYRLATMLSHERIQVIAGIVVRMPDERHRTYC